ncbi:MAG: DUF3310 domain-containing protein [Patescibacteria group bacterium]|nr:DUF3310 domain-containing protein [Patescibacteria group bacterium]
MSSDLRDIPSYYSNLGIDPRTLAMANHWDADAFSILKYLTRFDRKDGIKDVVKARNFAVMRRDFAPGPLMYSPRIRLGDYLEANGYKSKPLIRYAISALWDTVYVYDGVKLYSDHLIKRIDEIITHLESNPSAG